MTELDDPETGRLILGRYRIVRLLARGGMGAVHLARVEGAAGFAKPVVVKRILPHLTDSSEEQSQFIREARILSQLRHPGIVDVIDFGKEGSAYFMVLEYVPGYHLGQWLKYIAGKSTQMPWDIAVYVMIQVLNALHYAHTCARADGSRTTIVHRDISPSNILIDVDGNVRIVDFGIARIDLEQTGREATGKGEFRGKLPYAAPEQLSCESASPSSDTYSCGVVLYQLLSGENPFYAREPAVIMQRVVMLNPPAIDTIRRDAPSGLGDVLAKALSKERRDRYVSAQDFASALRTQLTTPETEIAARLTESVRNDFRGELPRSLNVQSLTELEAAWRRASGSPYTPVVASLPTLKVGRSGDSPVSVDVRAPTVDRVNATVVPTAKGTNRWLVVGVVSSVILAGFAAIFAVLATRTSGADPQSRFVVVESNTEREDRATVASGSTDSRTGSALAESAASVAPFGSAVATLVQGNPRESERTQSATVASKPRDPSSHLSRAFAKKQGAIQSCFRSNTMSVDGAPQIAIRFSIDAQGRVLSATVKPEAIAATSLGQCIETIAKTTDFGLQDKPMAFSIPITARVR